MFETRSEKGVMEHAQFLHCRNCVSLAVVVVAYFDLSSGCCHPWTEKASYNFYSLQLQFVINILQNQFQLDPRSLKRIILGYPKSTPVW